MNLSVLITALIVFAIFAVPFYLISRSKISGDDSENTPAEKKETEQLIARANTKKSVRHS